MPICRTCRGEYNPSETLCPACHNPLGGRSLNLCHHCGAETSGQRLCPRCYSDVSAWEKEQLTMLQFILRGGFFGLLPLLLMLITWLLVIAWRGYHPFNLLSTGIGVAAALILFRVLYIKRFFWRERFWAAQIYRENNPPLLLIILASLFAGIILLVLWLVLYAEILKEPQTMLEKLALTLPYVLGFIGLTIGLTMFAIQNYLDALDERVPQPLFVHTDRLLEVVLRTAGKSIKDGDSQAVEPGSLERFDVLQVVRNPADGGIRIWLKPRKPTLTTEEAAPCEVVPEETLWLVDADRWGRVRAIKRSTTTEDPWAGRGRSARTLGNPLRY